jgi:hypothetical protein
VTGVALRPPAVSDRARSWFAGSVEFWLVALFFAVWQAMVRATRLWHAGAYARGWAIWHFERSVHLPSEVLVQRAYLAVPVLARAGDVYYDVAHGASALIVLLVAWNCRSRLYGRVRTALLASAFLAFAVQLAPVAPPRLLGVPGLVDAASKAGVSLYGRTDLIDAYSAFPSLHVAWATVVALMVWASFAGWGRLLALHLPVTVWVVVGSGNHTWVDCAGGVAVGWFAWWAAGRVCCPKVPGFVAIPRDLVA